MRGLPAVYWRVLVNRWMERAFVCRYGGQDLYRILGRDPVHDPLSALEFRIFGACVEELVIAERRPAEELGLPITEEG